MEAGRGRVKPIWRLTLWCLFRGHGEPVWAVTEKGTGFRCPTCFRFRVSKVLKELA